MDKKIWVIDDDEGILSAFETALDGEGYSVKTFSTLEPLSLLKKHQMPDLILLDVLLSGIDGRTLCKKIKSNEETKHIPIIMVSAATNVEDSVRNSDADDFLYKPFELDELLTKVKKILG